MKRSILIIVALSLAASGAFAETTISYPALVPKNAKSMAMGGVFSAVPTAEFSFFGNPAAFASKPASFTALSVDTWAYVKPTSDNVDVLASALADLSENYGDLAGIMPTNGGVGGGFSVGLSAFAGKGLGLGFFVTSDEFAAGSDLPSSLLTSDTEISAVIGLGVPLTLGSLKLLIGGDVRPFYRIRCAEYPLADAVTAMTNDGEPLDSIYVYTGFGLAADLGATLELGAFTVGASVRDIAPPFPVACSSVTELKDDLSTGSIPATSGSGYSASFTPNVSAGLSWKPQILKGLVQPALYCELQDTVSVIKNWDGLGSALNLLHVGTEIQLIKLFYLRGGINRGWLSVGGGVKFLGLDLSAAVFTEELGALAGDAPRSGVALQAAIRF
jgi:hypothetical protein